MAVSEHAGGGGPYCEDCGQDLGRPGINFCPNCGTAQSPNVEVPQGPPPGIPEAGRIETAEVPVPPPPDAHSGGNGGQIWGFWERFLALSRSTFRFRCYSLSGVEQAM